MAYWSSDPPPDSIGSMILSFACVEIEGGKFGGWKKELLVKELTQTECELLLCEKCGGIAREAFTLDFEKSNSLRCVNCLPQQHDMMPGVKISPVYFLRGALQKKQAVCPFSICEWTNKITLLEDHLKDCEEMPIPCSFGCSEELKKREMKDHELNCDFAFVSCPNGCKDESGMIKSLRKKEVGLHLHVNCPLELVKCTYVDYGCEKMVKREDLEQHETDLMRLHLKLACNQLKIQGNENQQLRNRVNELENSTNNPIVGMIEMKIENIKHKIDNSEETQSDPFIVGHYKFQVCIEWDCENSGYVGCYLYLLRGDWDESLVWPVRYKYKFIILNQNNEDNFKRSGEISENEMRDCPSSFEQPKKDRNQGYGLKTFISRSECLRDRHTRNDSLTFRTMIQIVPSRSNSSS